MRIALTMLTLTVVCSPLTCAQESPANPEAVAAIKAVGGNVLRIALNDPRLDVTLHLANSDVTDELLPQVARLDRVVWLNLAGTKVTDAGLEHIASMKTLEKLHLEKTAVSDAGLIHVGKLENLVYLNLYGSKVTDAGLAHLHGLKKLQRIYVWQSGVTEQGINDLKTALPEVTIIGALDLKPVEPAQPEAEKKEEEKK